MSRKFRPLESKTPCENCKNVIHYNAGGAVKGVCKFANWKGRTKTACKDYREYEVKNSLFKNLYQWLMKWK